LPFTGEKLHIDKLCDDPMCIKRHQGDEIDVDVMDGACSTQKFHVSANFWSENVKRSDLLGELKVDKRMIDLRVTKLTEFFCLGTGTGCNGNCKEISGLKKEGEFGWLGNC
jgi:hypothetical protein